MCDKTEIISSLYAAAEDPECWEAALRKIAEVCEAQAAIITLRSGKSARVVVSTDMERESLTPYVAGIEPRYVEEYVTKYRALDIWADVQSTRRPITPTLMSKHVNSATLEAAPFWGWLKAQNINDTVVVEIGNSRRFWTAFNVFFWNDGTCKQDRILRIVNSLLPELKRAWKLGRAAFQTDLIKTQLMDQVSKRQGIALLLDEENTMLSASNPAEKLIGEGAIAVSEHMRLIALPSNIALTGAAKTFAEIGTTDRYPQYDNYIACLESNEGGSLSTGEFIGLRILAIVPNFAADVLPWEDPRLDPKTRSFLLEIASTGTIKQASKNFDITERYGRTLWRKGRESLGITKHDLIQIYKHSTVSRSDSKK